MNDPVVKCWSSSNGCEVACVTSWTSSGSRELATRPATPCPIAMREPSAMYGARPREAARYM
jgi:hypothetical protein